MKMRWGKYYFLWHGQWRKRRWIQLTGCYPPPFTGQYPLSFTCSCKCLLQITSLAVLPGTRTRNFRNARLLHCRSGYSGYMFQTQFLVVSHRNIGNSTTSANLKKITVVTRHSLAIRKQFWELFYSCIWTQWLFLNHVSLPSFSPNGQGNASSRWLARDLEAQHFIRLRKHASRYRKQITNTWIHSVNGYKGE